MNSLEQMIDELYDFLENKEQQLSAEPGFNTQTEKLLKQRREDVRYFRYLVKQYKSKSLPTEELINNFRKEANLLKKKIDEITNTPI